MLFRLNTLRAVVVDVPMDAHYDGETSSLRVHRVLPEFLFKHLRNAVKRVFYNYDLRDLSIASLGRVYPLMALAFVLVPVGSHFMFGESFRWQYFAGVGLIMLGIVVTVRG